jgi:NAD(P)-dependent dehydrogenase (short-subunit alcohol dehydrogenase family)
VRYVYQIETSKIVRFYLDSSPAGRPGTADEVANVAELLMSPKGAFITGSDFLMDGGATASYFYGPLNPDNNE